MNHGLLDQTNQHAETTDVPVYSFDANEVLDRLDSAQEALSNAFAEDSDEALHTQNACKKLVIQIPCLNEEETLGITLDQLPREIDGVEVVEWLVIDDGSSDRTTDVARAHCVDHIVRLPRNQGLARAFMAGLDEAIRQGAEIIVNTDADNQYCAGDIEKLIQPILKGEAEFVIGARPIDNISHFSRIKKLLQRFGSWIVRCVSGTDIPDAPSGFRAMSRETATRLNVFSDYTYTLETIIQAGQSNMAITSVQIGTNEDLRPSRLLKSVASYVTRSALTIVRIYMTYRPFQFFAMPGLASCAAGLVICMRFLWYYITASGVGHIQSLILGALLITLGFMGIVVGLVADLIAVNRKLLEKLDLRVHQLSESVSLKDEPNHSSQSAANHSP